VFTFISEINCIPNQLAFLYLPKNFMVPGKKLLKIFVYFLLMKEKDTETK